jgi:hypothetical protein
VFGFGRIPIVSWLRAQADESLLHAQQVGEWITALGEYPSLEIGPLLDSHKTDIGAMLRESLEVEGRALVLYRELLDVVEGQSVALEEFARQMIEQEDARRRGRQDAAQAWRPRGCRARQATELTLRPRTSQTSRAHVPAVHGPLTLHSAPSASRSFAIRCPWRLVGGEVN